MDADALEVIADLCGALDKARRVLRGRHSGEAERIDALFEDLRRRAISDRALADCIPPRPVSTRPR